MDVQLEKAAIIKRLEKVNDESLIKAFKSLLDYALNQEEEDPLLETSIDKALDQSTRGKTRPHKQVMSELRKKYEY